MKLCIMHTGHPKTGTTSLQHFLAGNADALRAQGILYPVLSRDKDLSIVLPWARYQHGTATRAIAAGKDTHHSGSPVHDLERQIADHPHDVLVISSESLFFEVLLRKHSVLPGWFRSKGYEIETVSYLRDQPDRFNSAYSQYSKTLSSAEFFDEYVTRRLTHNKADEVETRPMSYGLLTNPDLALWGTHTFRPFAEEVKRTGVEKDFVMTLRAILDRRGMGLTLTEEHANALAMPPRQNEGDGPVLIEAGRRIAAHLTELFADHEVPQLLRAEGFRDLSIAVEEAGIESRKYSGLTPRLYRRIRNRFRETNETFARKIWGCAWEDHFPDRPRKDLISNDVNDTHDPVHLAQVEELVGKVIPVLLQKLETDENFWELLMLSKSKKSRQSSLQAQRKAKRQERVKGRAEDEGPRTALRPEKPANLRAKGRRKARLAAAQAQAQAQASETEQPAARPTIP